MMHWRVLGSLLLFKDVNWSISTKQSTRVWGGVQNAQSQILHHAHSYQQAWKALKCIGTEEDIKFYQKLNQTDLVVVKDISMGKMTLWLGFGSLDLAKIQ